MKTNHLTIKQEAFAQAYVRLGDKSAAYREAYSSGNMKAETIHNKAYALFNNGKVRARIEQLQQEIQDRNRITIDELVQSLAGMVRFDIGDMYDEGGNLLSLIDMPKHARLMIQNLEIEESRALIQDSITTTQTKKVKVIDKLGAIEKLMKHLGGYERDNAQKKTDITITWNEERTYDTSNNDKK